MYINIYFIFNEIRIYYFINYIVVTLAYVPR